MANLMKKILTAVLSLAMVACFVPQMNAPAYAADGDPAMVAGAESVLKSTANTDNAQTVWYAGKPWRVIKYKDTGNDYITYPEGQKNAMTLFSSDLLATGKQFNSNWQAETANDYDGSDLQNTVNGLYDELFSTDEKKAVIERTLTVDEYVNSSPYSTGVSGDSENPPSGYLWPLSTAEALKLPDTFRSANDYWWLRSPGGFDYYTAIVTGGGGVGNIGGSVDNTCGVRPAFDLNLNSVLFTSAAVGGKSSGAAGADALTEVGTNSGSEWKLTLKSGHDDFEITECAPTANGVSVKYKGAIAGTEDKPEYISAIITDKPITDSTAKIKYYGRIAKASGDDDASVTINTAGKLKDGDTLYVFNEQYNGDKMTDYASALQEVEVPPASMAMGSDVLSKNAGKNGAQTVWYAGSPWRVIGYNGGGVASTEGDMTLLASDNLQTGVQFNTNDKDNNDYEGSNLKDVIDGLYADRFSPGEKTAVKNRTLKVGEYTDYEPYSTGVSGTATSGHLWPLSTAEALEMNVSGALKLLAANGHWWLRSPGNHDRHAVSVYRDGSVGYKGHGVHDTTGVRPAFNLNLESVLFTSAAEGGKSSGAAGALNEVGTNKTGKWKLTLLDNGTITGPDSHKTFKIDQAGITADPAAGTVTVPYSGAKTGTKEYISAIIKDSDGNIKYYGRIAKASAADNASVPINIGGKFGSGDTLWVFNEQYNGDETSDQSAMTDYASALQEVKLYQITFHPNNGTPTFTETVEAGGKIKTERVYWEGHDFLGWYTDEAFDDPYDYHAEVNSSFDLYGRWRPNNFDINFVNEDGTELQSCKVAYGDTPSYTGQTPTKKDDAKYSYTFAGWTPEIKPVTGDATYKATYTAKKKPAQPQPDPKPQPKINKAAAKIALDAGVVARSSGSKVTASWGAVKGASSYVIYANYCDQKECKKIKTVSGKTTSFDITKLNDKKFDPKKNLKFYVVAYKTVKGKKVKLAKSIMAHAPGSKNTKRTNVTGVKVKKASFTLKKGKTAKIKAKLVLQKKNKKPLKHCAKFRYASSNKKVAKVSKKGKITAVGKGKCTVYVYAVSGVSKKIKVTVK